MHPGPTQGYDSDAAGNMHIFHDCCKFFLCTCPELPLETPIMYVLSFTEHYVGALLRDMQAHVYIMLYLKYL